MDDLTEYAGTEFSKLLLRTERVDWARFALELAADGQRGLDPAPTLQWIQERHDELLGPVATAWSEYDALRRLTDCLAEQHGLIGDPNASATPDGYYLNRIIETGRGTPIGLAVLYFIVAQTLQIDLQPVASPKRFLTRYESTEGPIFLDPYDRGRLMDIDECLDWLADVGEPAEVRGRLQPAGSRRVALHLLNRLKIAHIQQEDWPAAWRVQQRLFALQPTSYEERRALAILATKAERLPQAVELLRDCLQKAPPSDTPLLSAYLRTAEARLAHCN
ncbi:MAG: tetratricopeptide repeat protein [Planctomycetes bacterium]|nr:tetratricopeptide repeat protein [Planctomycetota bacterium]